MSALTIGACCTWIATLRSYTALTVRNDTTSGRITISRSVRNALAIICTLHVAFIACNAISIHRAIAAVLAY